MEEKVVIRSNTYFDSVTLMAISQQVMRFEGVEGAMIGMGTPLNREVLDKLGFGASVEAGPNDLILAVRGESAVQVSHAFEEAEKLMTHGTKKTAGSQGPAKSLDEALERQPTNLALISVPGTYAAREARKALEKGLHVMLFSDNVSLEDEVVLKQLGHQKGLLVMGPDCGTAMLNGVPLAFANRVQRGKIGIVGASGTGTQDVSVQIDRMGQGISQMIGTGGRDLKDAVGGIMMLDGIKALAEDPETNVIVVISKPASPKVTEKVFQALEECGKPAVLYVVGSKREFKGSERVKSAMNLLETAQLAVELAGGRAIPKGTVDRNRLIQAQSTLKREQKYVRGLFSGGTLCDEAMEVLAEHLGLIYSHGPLNPAGQLTNPNQSINHTVLDLGDDFFTVGRPHPMIDFSLRAQRVVEEAKDPEVAVILLDIVLGYGSNADPAAEMIPAIQKAQAIASDDGRNIIFVAYVCGTPQDPQGLTTQMNALRDAGVLLFPSNGEAAEFTAQILMNR